MEDQFNRKTLEDQGLTDFVRFCRASLGYKAQARIVVSDDHSRAVEMKSMAAYSLDTGEIWVLRGSRLRADWYRSLAHELTHHAQRDSGKELDGSDGSDCENEANSRAGEILRAWGREHPEIYEAEVNEGLARKYTEYLYLKDKGLLPKDSEDPSEMAFFMVTNMVAHGKEEFGQGKYQECYGWLEEAEKNLKSLMSEVEKLGWPG